MCWTQALLMQAIPVKTIWVEVQEARTAFLTSKLIDQIADDKASWSHTQQQELVIQDHPSENSRFVVGDSLVVPPSDPELATAISPTATQKSDFSPHIKV